MKKSNKPASADLLLYLSERILTPKIHDGDVCKIDLQPVTNMSKAGCHATLHEITTEWSKYKRIFKTRRVICIPCRTCGTDILTSERNIQFIWPNRIVAGDTGSLQTGIQHCACVRRERPPTISAELKRSKGRICSDRAVQRRTSAQNRLRDCRRRSRNGLGQHRSNGCVCCRRRR